MRKMIHAITFTLFFQGTLLSLFILSCGLTNAEAGERWTLVGKSQTETKWYINMDSLSGIYGPAFSFWVRSIPDKTATEKEEDTEEILRGIQRRNFGDYDYTEALWQIDCEKCVTRVLYFVAYQKDGQRSAELLTPEAPWAEIIPGSPGAAFMDAVCGKPR